MRFTPRVRLPLSARFTMLALGSLAALAIAIAVVGCAKNGSVNPYAPNNMTPAPSPPPPAPTETFDSGVISSGSFSHTFANAGDFAYPCTLHAVCCNMRGTVHVAAGLPMAVSVAVSNFTYTPTTANIAPGGTVTWTWGGTSHSVTAP